MIIRLRVPCMGSVIRSGSTTQSARPDCRRRCSASIPMKYSANSACRRMRSANSGSRERSADTGRTATTAMPRSRPAAGCLFLRLCLGVISRLRLDDAPDLVLERGTPVGLWHPLPAVPHLDTRLAAAAMILRGDGDRSHESIGVVVLDAFETFLDLLRRQRPAVLLDSKAGAFGGDRPDRQTGVVVDVFAILAA